MKVFGIVLPLAAWNRWPRIIPIVPVVPSFLFGEVIGLIPKFLKHPLAARFGDTVALEFRLDTAEFKEMVWGVSCFLVAMALLAAWKKPCSAT